jgi:VWFA-related protein
MVNLGCKWLGLLLAATLLAETAKAQPVQQIQSHQQTDSHEIPDAPSATRPPETFPTNPSSGSSLPSAPEPQPSTQPTARPSSSSTTSDPSKPPPPSTPKVAGAPAGAADVSTSSRNELYTLVKRVNFVIVPVTVKDDSGRLVDGLLQKDFSVYEDGVKQRITLFTSDPFPLSAAVIIDTGMADIAFQKVKQSLTALESAFSQFDELSVYTYSNVVQKEVDFTAVSQKLDLVLKQLRESKRKGSGGVPVIGGPINSGPTINGRPADPGSVVMNTPVTPSHVLNDAVLTATLDLSKRDPTRRKVIFIISDGREIGSRASYSDVLKVLLSHNVALYAVAVDSAAIPGYNTLEKIRLPRFGASNILPKYASATGGQVFAQFSRQAIESAYGQVTREARNQYTIGYMARATPSSNKRTVDIRVDRGGLQVTAKDGYYPLPPGR